MLRDWFNLGPKNELVEIIRPQKTFADVVLPENTRRQLYDALIQIDKHRLIYQDWGLGERHQVGTGLAFNFAGPPGTGKTICAEAVARALGKKLCRVRYSEVESMWAGQTGKNVTSVFREARSHDAVLFFDEADSIAARRFTTLSFGYEREANQAVNILLKELEDYEGVVIFATNLATNVDPAFERRIRTHILFEMPGAEERERIWQVQIHPTRTPLDDDVSFPELAESHPVSGGDIKNAVLLAAQMAAGEEGADETKRIAQRHFVAAMDRVRTARQVSKQSLFDQEPEETGLQQAWAAAAMENRLDAVDTSLAACGADLATLKEEQSALSARWHEVGQEMTSVQQGVAALKSEFGAQLAAHEKALAERLAEWQARLDRATLIPLPRAALLAAALTVIGLAFLGGHYLWP